MGVSVRISGDIIFLGILNFQIYFLFPAKICGNGFFFYYKYLLNFGEVLFYYFYACHTVDTCYWYCWIMQRRVFKRRKFRAFVRKARRGTRSNRGSFRRRYGSSGRRNYRGNQRRRGGGGSFADRVTRVQARNHGLKEVQDCTALLINRAINDPIAFHYEIIGTPQNYTSNGILSNGAASQSFLRSEKLKTVYHNQSNVPVTIELRRFTVRRSIPLSQYASMGALLNDGTSNASVTNVYNFYTGNALRRFIKLGRARSIMLMPGQVKTLRTGRFFRTPRRISGDIEGQNLYLATPFSIGTFIRFIPAMIAQPALFNGNNASYAVMHTTYWYFSWYQMQEDFPTSTATETLGTITTGSNIYEAQISQAISSL